MPNGDERQAFRDWVRRTKGWWRLIVLASAYPPTNYDDRRLYDEWIYLGKPGPEVEEEEPVPEPGSEVPPPEEEEEEEMVPGTQLTYSQVRDLAARTGMTEQDVIRALMGFPAAEVPELEGMTEAQRAQASWQRQQAAWQQEQAGREFGAEQDWRQSQLAQQREQGLWQRGQAEWERGLTEQQLAQERQETMAQLRAQPSSWIQAWEFENMPTPATAVMGRERLWEELTPEERGARMMLGEMGKAGYSGFAGASTRKMIEEGYADPRAYERAKATAEAVEQPYPPGPYPVTMPGTEKEAWRLHFASQPPGPGPAAVRPTGPQAPEWLPEFVPGLEAGQPITKQRTTLASGQQWGRTPWSQREMLGGFLEWASPKGIPTLRDYEELVRQQLPKPTPKARVRPARQV